MRWEVEDTPERAAFRAEFRGWLKRNLPAGWCEAIEAGDDDAYAAARAGWNMFEWGREFGLSGYSAPLWPREYGGLSGEVWMQQLVREELERHRLPSFGVNILGVGLAGPTIIAHGTEAQKERYLRKILTSEEIWCQLFSEPGSGSDLASVGTRAERSGDEWIVNGQKVWTTIAQLASFGLLLARTDPNRPKHEGLTYLIVDMKAPGVEIRPLVQMSGGQEFNEVYFTDVRIPDENRVGDVNDGWRCARTTLANERATIAGLSLDMGALLGAPKKDPWRTFLDGVRDTKDRVNRQAIARFYTDNEVKEITSFRANSARLRGATPGPEGSFGKLYNAELNQRRANFAMNAAGIGAVAWEKNDREAESRVHNFLRSRANTLEGGTSEVLRSQIGERILGLPRDIEVDKDVAWRDVKRN